MKKIFVTVLMAAAVCACDKVTPEPEPEPQPPVEDDGGFEEPVPDRPEYVNANLIYYGGDDMDGSSDYWVLNLYTDMEVRDGYPVGPEMYEIDLPGGSMMQPDGCFFGDIPSGETEFEADLLREGSFAVTDNGDGTFTVEGIMVGTEYMKRYFSYTGKFEPVDRAEEGQGTDVPNTNLTEDVLLEGLTEARLIDKGDYFFTGEGNYRLFLLYIAEPGVNLSQDWPSGTGRLLHLELFVPADADPADGIPAGEYIMANRINGGYMDKESIVPFRIVEGAADVFEYNTGTWYQEIKEGVWVNYGRITGGTVTVDRNGDSHTLTIE